MTRESGQATRSEPQAEGAQRGEAERSQTGRPREGQSG